MTIDSKDIRPGMRVVDADGALFGEVTEIRRDDILVHRQGQPDLALLRAAIEEVREDEVVLKTTADQIINLAWATPAAPVNSTTAPADFLPPPVDLADEPQTEIPPANLPAAEQIETGLTVLTSDGQELGTVKELGAERFLIDRPRARDIWVSDQYVDHVGGGAVILRLDQAAVDATEWEHPPLI